MTQLLDNRTGITENLHRQIIGIFLNLYRWGLAEVFISGSFLGYFRAGKIIAPPPEEPDPHHCHVKLNNFVYD